MAHLAYLAHRVVTAVLALQRLALLWGLGLLLWGRWPRLVVAEGAAGGWGAPALVAVSAGLVGRAVEARLATLAF